MFEVQLTDHGLVCMLAIHPFLLDLDYRVR